MCLACWFCAFYHRKERFNASRSLVYTFPELGRHIRYAVLCTFKRITSGHNRPGNKRKPHHDNADGICCPGCFQSVHGFCQTIGAKREECRCSSVRLLGDGVPLCRERVYRLGGCSRLCLGCGLYLCCRIKFGLGSVHFRYKHVFFFLQGFGCLHRIKPLHRKYFLFLGLHLCLRLLVCELCAHALCRGCTCFRFGFNGCCLCALYLGCKRQT